MGHRVSLDSLDIGYDPQNGKVTVYEQPSASLSTDDPIEDLVDGEFLSQEQLLDHNRLSSRRVKSALPIVDHNNYKVLR